MHPNPKRIVPVIFLLGLAAFAWWYFNNQRAVAVAEIGALKASGTIEAVQVVVSTELGGRVLEVLAKEGDTVQAGQVLARFDDTLLQAQLIQAKAVLAQAQANYDLIAAGVPAEQRQASIASAELEITSAQQALDDLNKTADLAAARAYQAVAAIEKNLDRATQRLDSIQGQADPADIEAAKAAIVLAKDRLDKIHKDFAPYEKKSEDNLVRAMLQAKLADAQKKYDALVQRLNNLLGKANQFDLNLAEADKALVEAQLADARRQYDETKDGPDPEALALAEARLAAAKARLAAAKANPTAEQLALAQTQVDTARAAVDVLQVQLDKLTLKAPMDDEWVHSGRVLSRTVEPGEVALPGTPMMTLARLDDLTITVYVQEDRYGEVSLGQEALVTVDSFPSVAFTAVVVHIADQAEFTPRNVQTAEGRRTTVFAVKLSLKNPEGKLKPGMPADVLWP